MKNSIYKIVFLSLLSTLLFNCSSEKEIAKTLPQLSTTAATAITLTTASSGGNITADGGAAVTARGIVWNTATAPTISLATKTTDGSGTGNFTSTVANLSPSTNYYARAYATNSVGTGYGNEITFTTGAVGLPTLTTTAISNITSNSAISGGTITADGGGAITARGLVWSTSQNPTITLTTKTSDGTGTGNFISTMATLNSGVAYYIRSYATNIIGTAYGNQISFTTPQCNTGSVITDIEGNTYNTIVIGNQTWMKENLRTTKYNNGDVIPNIAISSQWNTTTIGGWADYNNLINNLYGKLYNGYAVVDTRGLCPCGFHIPTRAEWTILENNLTMQGANTGIVPAKAIASKINWSNSNISGAVGNNSTTNNTSEFSGFPNGWRSGGSWGKFEDSGNIASWWLSTLSPPDSMYAPFIYFNYSTINTFSRTMDFGLSIRCLKN